MFQLFQLVFNPTACECHNRACPERAPKGVRQCACHNLTACECHKEHKNKEHNNLHFVYKVSPTKTRFHLPERVTARPEHVQGTSRARPEHGHFTKELPHTLPALGKHCLKEFQTRNKIHQTCYLQNAAQSSLRHGSVADSSSSISSRREFLSTPICPPPAWQLD